MESTSTDSNRKGYTAPKGRPTARNGVRAVRRGLSPTVEWVIVVLLLLAVFAAIFYFGRNFSSGGGGGGTTGAGVPLTVVQVAAAALGV